VRERADEDAVLVEQLHLLGEVEDDVAEAEPLDADQAVGAFIAVGRIGVGDRAVADDVAAPVDDGDDVVAAARTRIDGGVGVAVAVERVVAAIALEQVVAAEAGQDVVAGAAEQISSATAEPSTSKGVVSAGLGWKSTPAGVGSVPSMLVIVLFSMRMPSG
jgi:hypothetical protein